MLNLFQHPTCKVYIMAAICPVGCRNKFGMALNFDSYQNKLVCWFAL